MILQTQLLCWIFIKLFEKLRNLIQQKFGDYAKGNDIDVQVGLGV